MKWRLLIALGLLLLPGLVVNGRSDIVKSARRSDGLLDFAFDVGGQEVPDKYPLQLRNTAFADIAVGHARKDQSGGILVSGLAQQRFGAPSFGPNAKIEVVAPWWQLQPDFQYYINPSAGVHAANAAVLGVRMTITF